MPCHCATYAVGSTGFLDGGAADLLAQVSDRDRRAVASKGVREAAAEYLAESGDD